MRLPQITWMKDHPREECPALLPQMTWTLISRPSRRSRRKMTMVGGVDSQSMGVTSPQHRQRKEILTLTQIITRSLALRLVTRITTRHAPWLVLLYMHSLAPQSLARIITGSSWRFPQGRAHQCTTTRRVHQCTTKQRAHQCTTKQRAQQCG